MHSNGTLSDRTVEPIAVVGDEPHWYLWGWCRLRDEPRALRIDRISGADANGNPQHFGDMRKQITFALDNLGAVLHAAGMDRIHITRLTLHTTDVDEAMQHFDVLGARFGPVDAAPPMTLLGVTPGWPSRHSCSRSRPPPPTDRELDRAS